MATPNSKSHRFLTQRDLIDSTRTTHSAAVRRIVASISVLALALTVSSCSMFEDADVARCKELVTERLASPGSASFGDIAVDAWDVNHAYITGWVDSENGFGALMRSNFTCSADVTAESNGKKVVTLESIEK